MTARRCTHPTDAGPCGRVMVADSFCLVHDRIECTAPVIRNHRHVKCGTRLVDGLAQRCPNCGSSVKLNDVLRGQR